MASSGGYLVISEACRPPHREKKGRSLRRPQPVLLVSSSSFLLPYGPVIVMYGSSKPAKVSVYVKLSSEIQIRAYFLGRYPQPPVPRGSHRAASFGRERRLVGLDDVAPWLRQSTTPE